ncbi:MAG: hypothetical protein WAZ77_02750 [Candidatus Nitrosopolaris sp.]
MMKLQRSFKDLVIGGITSRWYDNSTRKSRLVVITLVLLVSKREDDTK